MPYFWLRLDNGAQANPTKVFLQLFTTNWSCMKAEKVYRNLKLKCFTRV